MANYDGVIAVITEEARQHSAPANILENPGFNGWVTALNNIISSALNTAGFTEASSTFVATANGARDELAFDWEEDSTPYSAKSDIQNNRGPITSNEP